MTIDLTQTQARDKTHTHEMTVAVATGPASYTTGGDPVTPATFLLSRLDALLFEPFWNGTTAYIARYNPTNLGVQFINPTTGAEIASGTNLSTFTAHFVAIGTP